MVQRENKTDGRNKSQKLASSFGLALSKYLAPLLLANPDAQCKLSRFSIILANGGKTKQAP